MCSLKNWLYIRCERFITDQLTCRLMAKQLMGLT